MSARPSSTSRSRAADTGSSSTWSLTVAAHLIDWSEVPIRGTKQFDSEHELVIGLAKCAARDGPLDPAVRGSRERWLEDVLPRVLTNMPELALSAARVWREALDVRPGAPDDLPSSAYAIAIISLVAAGDARGFERWLTEARGEAEAEELDDQRWIEETVEALGLTRY